MQAFRNLSFMLFLMSAACAQATDDIAVRDAWVRATAPGQQVAAAYMDLSSLQGTTLVGAECDIAGIVEIHEMTMKNDVMKMRMLKELALPAGETVRLAPGGLHLMLFDLKQPLNAGSKAECVLRFRNAQGETANIRATLPVKAGNTRHH
ncbi:MAG TPA: copper chaperone PCu(A)C [Methylophilaceae bacterium]|jgi:copper(I)-binding protein